MRYASGHGLSICDPLRCGHTAGWVSRFFEPIAHPWRNSRSCLESRQARFCDIAGCFFTPALWWKSAHDCDQRGPNQIALVPAFAESVVQALVSGNSIEPAGNANVGDYQALVTTDSTVGQITDLLEIPLRTGGGLSVYLRDVGTVSDSSDILAGYALLNSKRTVYIPVTRAARRFDNYRGERSSREPRAISILDS